MLLIEKARPLDRALLCPSIWVASPPHLSGIGGFAFPELRSVHNYPNRDKPLSHRSANYRLPHFRFFVKFIPQHRVEMFSDAFPSIACLWPVSAMGIIELITTLGAFCFLPIYFLLSHFSPLLVEFLLYFFHWLYV